MPRSQRVQLTKAPIVETEAGVLDSDVVKTQAFAAQKAMKTPGQELAESIGLAAKGLTSIYEASEKDRENEEIIAWSLYGQSEGRGLLAKLAKAELTDHKNIMKDSLESFRASFESRSGGRGVSAGGFRAGFGAFTDFLGQAETTYSNTVTKMQLTENTRGINTHLKTMFKGGSTLTEMMTYAASNKNVYVDPRDAQIDTIKTISEIANVAMQANPNMDMESFIEQHMKGKTLDGKLDLYAVKDIKTIVDNVRKDHRENRNAFNAITLESKLKHIQDNKVRTYSQIETWDAEGVLTSNMIDQLKAEVDSNQATFYNDNRNTLYVGIGNGSVSLKDIDEALRLDTVTVPHHAALKSTYHSSIASKSVLEIHRSLTKDFGQNMTIDRMHELLGKKNNDGDLIYQSAHVKKAWKQVISNEYNRLARGQFSDKASLRTVFFNANMGGVKLEAFEAALTTMTVDANGELGVTLDALNDMKISPQDKNAAVEKGFTNTQRLINDARSGGYRTKAFIKFEKERAIWNAEKEINPGQALLNYTQTASFPGRNEVATLANVQQALKLHAPELWDDEEQQYAALQAPFLQDIYNVALNRKNSSPLIAAQATAQYMKRTMVQLVVQGSGSLSPDDRIWVSRDTGINNQDQYDKVVDYLSEYYGYEFGVTGGTKDDMQLYNMSQVDPDSEWLLRNLNGEKMFKVPAGVIRLLVTADDKTWRNAFKKMGLPEKYVEYVEKKTKNKE